MLTKRLFLISILPLALVGCAGLSGSQPPAPVYQSRPAAVRPAPVPVAPTPEPPTAPESSENIQIKALPEAQIAPMTELPAEPLNNEQPAALLTPEQEQELAALQQLPNTNATTPTPATEPNTPEAASKPAPTEVKPTPSIPPIVTEVPAPETPPPLAFEPLTSFAPLSPAIGALVIAANKNAEGGNLPTAATTIERAIRIEPRNATLYYKLALLRMKEAKPRLAEDLAKKAAQLAANDAPLKKHSWLLIAKAREIQKNYDGAKEAKAKADGL